MTLLPHLPWDQGVRYVHTRISCPTCKFHENLWVQMWQRGPSASGPCSRAGDTQPETRTRGRGHFSWLPGSQVRGPGGFTQTPDFELKKEGCLGGGDGGGRL